jgi:hypothetical protein
MITIPKDYPKKVKTELSIQRENCSEWTETKAFLEGNVWANLSPTERNCKKWLTKVSRTNRHDTRWMHRCAGRKIKYNYELPFYYPLWMIYIGIYT